MNESMNATLDSAPVLSKAKKTIFSFFGTARRAEYFGITSATFVTGALLGYLLESYPTSRLLAGISLLLLIPGVWLNIAAGVRRCHDLGRSGWLYLVTLIPLVNLFFFCYLVCARGSSSAPELGQPKSTPLAFSAKQLAPQIVEDNLYDEIAHELDTSTVNRSIWTKAFAIADGDENKAKANYIKLRVQQAQEAHQASGSESSTSVSQLLAANESHQARPIAWLWAIPAVLLLVALVNEVSSNKSSVSGKERLAEQIVSAPAPALAVGTTPLSVKELSKSQASVGASDFAGIRFDITPEELMQQGFGCSNEGYCRNVGSLRMFEGHDVDEFYVRFIGRTLRSITIKFINDKMLSRTQLASMQAAVSKKYKSQHHGVSKNMATYDQEWTVKDNAKISLFATSMNYGNRFYTVFEFIDNNVRE